MLLALACVLGLVENALVPQLPVPGVRLGFANIAVVAALALVGDAEALGVSVLRVVVVGLATGTLGGPSVMLAMSGALASWAVMSALKRAGESFSVLGWSVGGSAAHVAAQLFAASAVVGSIAPLRLLPMGLAAALLTGLVIGRLSLLLVSRVPLKTVEMEEEADGTEAQADITLVS